VLKLHVVQAEYGDCLILESSTGKNSNTVLIDGGPYQTFEKHLKPSLQKLPINGKLDLVVLSHIDNDYIIGLIDLLEEIKGQRENGAKELVNVSKLWHNSFNDLLQTDEDPNKLLKKTFPMLNFRSKEDQKIIKNFIASIIMKGFQQARDLTALAKSLINILSREGREEEIQEKLNNLNNDKNHMKGLISIIFGILKKEITINIISTNPHLRHN